MLPPSSPPSLAFSLISLRPPPSHFSFLLPFFALFSRRCDISLTAIAVSSPMKYKCLSRCCSFSPSISFPFAQKKRKKEPDEPPTAEQFPGMTRMFVPHRLPFAFHLRDRLSSWPPLTHPPLFFPFSSFIRPQRLQMEFRQREKTVFYLVSLTFLHFLSLPFSPFLVSTCVHHVVQTSVEA